MGDNESLLTDTGDTNGGGGDDNLNGGSGEAGGGQDQGGGEQHEGGSAFFQALPEDALAGIPEDLRGHESFKDVKDLGDLLNRHKDASERLAALGTPVDGPEGYEFDDSQFEGLTLNDAYKTRFLQTATDLRLTKEQVAGLAKMDAEQQKADQEAYKQARADFRGESEKALKEEWGDDFEQELNLSHRGVRTVAQAMGDEGEAFVNLLKESGAGDHPLFIKAFNIIAKGYAEDSLAGDGGGREKEPERTAGGRPKLKFNM